MSQSPSIRIPSYRLHKPTGQAVVRLNGHDTYLGKHGTPKSQAAYRRVIGEWLAAAKLTPNVEPSAPGFRRITVSELLLAYLRFGETYYVKNGRPTGELANIEYAITPLATLYGSSAAAEFGPLALKAVRQQMVDSGLCRSVVNARVNRIRRVFKWAVENQHIPPTVLQSLQAVAPLKAGRCAVREQVPVRPVPDAWVNATLKALPAPLAAMVELQRLTGMRPGEVVIMRATDIDTTGPIWAYTPSEHKTEHHRRRRVIYLGPQAQAVLRPFLKPDLTAYLFDPREVVGERRRWMRAARQTPMTPSQLARQKRAQPRRTPGNRYTTLSYARAIAYACDRAFPHPEFGKGTRLTPGQREQLKAWQAEHRWSPNQLRHNAATSLRKRFGIEAARVVLGHSSASVTEIYAEQDMEKAADIMRNVG